MVIAEPCKLDGARVVSGVVPGEQQANNRAELLAVLAAILSGTGGSVYSDSEVAVSGFRKIQQQGWSPLLWRKHENLDVWSSIDAALQRSPRRWYIIKVKSHREWRTATDDYHAWLWYHNQQADVFAKRAMEGFGCGVLEAHVQAQRAWQDSCLRQDAVYQLQLGVSDCFRDAKRTTKESCPGAVSGDMLQLKLQALGMMLCDVGVPFPGRYCEPDWGHFLLCAPFGHLLFRWFSSMEWVWDPGGFSLLEMYYAFTGQTGWVVPLNLAGWVDGVRPVGCRGVKVKSLWVHETQYPQLALHRQALTCQLVTFAHTVRSVFQHCKCDWNIQNIPALRFAGVPCKVPAILFRPKLPHAATIVQKIHRDMCGREYRLYLKTCYVAPRTPLASQLEYPDPQQVFAMSRRFHRQNR